MDMAIYPGSFDPFTIGHYDVLLRAQKLFGKILVAVAADAAKRTVFAAPERVTMIREALRTVSGIEVVSFEGLLAAFMRTRGIRIAIRGIRTAADLAYEMEMASANRMLNTDMDTVFIGSEGRFAQISSTLVREIASHGGDISPFVPPAVVPFIAAKFPRSR
ncbi:MAG: pantetheine-phosphate adenylyltransferase [Spirochaetota bacterium]